MSLVGYSYPAPTVAHDYMQAARELLRLTPPGSHRWIIGPDVRRAILLQCNLNVRSAGAFNLYGLPVDIGEPGEFRLIVALPDDMTDAEAKRVKQDIAQAWTGVATGPTQRLGCRVCREELPTGSVYCIYCGVHQ